MQPGRYAWETNNVLETTARGRGRPKCVPDDTKCDAIVSCARQLFVKKGYGATTTDDIAAACKISKQTLYRLFPSKSALFAAVVEIHRQKWLSLPHEDDHLPLAAALEQIFMIDIDDEADRERIEVISLVLAEGRNYPELSDILKQQGADIARAQLAQWLSRQCEAGRLRPQDTTSTAQMLLDMVFGAMITKNVTDVIWPAGAQRRAHIRNCIDVFLHGVAPASAGHNPAEQAALF